MRLYAIYVTLLFSSLSYGQDSSYIEVVKKKQSELSFYYDYIWINKHDTISDGSIYRSKLIKQPELQHLAHINRTFDSTNKQDSLRPFLSGVSGLDPISKQIKFLDFSRNGMMIEGTIELVGTHRIEYNFDFSYPGNKNPLKGRDVLVFNHDKTEFVWTSYLILVDGESKKLSEMVMIRDKIIE